MSWTSNPSHFCVFRFLFGRGTDVHLPSQENEIQPISQQPSSVSKFIICLFRHAEAEPFRFCLSLYFALFVAVRHSEALEILINRYTLPIYNLLPLAPENCELNNFVWVLLLILSGVYRLSIRYGLSRFLLSLCCNARGLLA